MAGELPMPHGDWALFFDIDGTLIEIASSPAAAIVPPELRANLAALHGILSGAVALISGRAIADIDRMFAPLKFAAAGQHGAERRDDLESVVAAPSPELESIAAALDEFAAGHPGVLVERKGCSLAVHFRQAPQFGDDARAKVQDLVAGASNLEWLPARMACDVRPRGLNKGVAIEWFLARAPFRGRVPIFVGDDVTDEDGYAVVEARGGYSIRVGFRGDSGARHRLRSPSELRQWLSRCIGELSQGKARRE